MAYLDASVSGAAVFQVKRPANTVSGQAHDEV